MPWLLLTIVAAGASSCDEVDSLDPLLLQTKSVLERSSATGSTGHGHGHGLIDGALSCRDHDVPPENRSREVFYLHLPKTAGCSAMADLSRMVSRENIWSHEVCFDYSLPPAKFSKTVTVLRRPRDHVLSMYEYCKNGDNKTMTMMMEHFNSMPGQSNHTLPETFEEWVRLWRDEPIYGDYMFFDDAFHCYCPVNLQTTRMVCKDSYQAKECRPDADLQLALQRLDSFSAVGITEAYQETMCLFEEKITGILPIYCACQVPFMWDMAQPAQVHESQGSSYTKYIEDYDEKVLQMVDNLTSLDWQLYRHGVRRFISELEELSSRYGVTVLCDDVKQKLRRDAFLES